MTEILEKAIEHYGAKNQMIKSIEELSELSQALCKYLVNPNINNKLHVFEEMADAQIMLNQLGIIFNHDSLISQYATEKIDRLEKRLENSVSFKPNKTEPYEIFH